MDFTQIIWIVFLAFTVWPMIKQQNLARARLRIHQEIEKKRGSRLITMIHRQEGVSLLGIQISRYIDIEDSEQVLRAIRLTPDDMPIDIVLHTPGGLVLAAELQCGVGAGRSPAGPVSGGIDFAGGRAEKHRPGG